jgi:hypothetical protein
MKSILYEGNHIGERSINLQQSHGCSSLCQNDLNSTSTPHASTPMVGMELGMELAATWF